MGFFKRIFKGIGKVFRKIGKGIKKAFKSIGKVMNKIGIVGQLGMMFLFPGGIGNALLKGLGNLGTTLSAVQGTGVFSQAIQGVGKILTGAKNFVAAAKTGFSSITNGIKEFGKTALSKVGIKLDGAAPNFFKTTDAAGNPVSTAFSETRKGFEAAFGEAGDLLRGDTLKLRADVKDINDLSNKVGISKDQLLELNPDLGKYGDELPIPSGENINTSLKDLYGTNKISPEQVQEAFGSYSDTLEKGIKVDPEGAGFASRDPFSRKIKNEVEANTVEEGSNFLSDLGKGLQKDATKVKDTLKTFNPSEVGFLEATKNVAKATESFREDDLEIDYDTPGQIISAPGDAFYEPDRDASFLAGYSTNNIGVGPALNRYQDFFQYIPFQPFSIQPTPFMRS